MLWQAITFQKSIEIYGTLVLINAANICCQQLIGIDSCSCQTFPWGVSTRLPSSPAVVHQLSPCWDCQIANFIHLVQFNVRWSVIRFRLGDDIVNRLEEIIRLTKRGHAHFRRKHSSLQCGRRTRQDHLISLHLFNFNSCDIAPSKYTFCA